MLYTENTELLKLVDLLLRNESIIYSLMNARLNIQEINNRVEREIEHIKSTKFEDAIKDKTKLIHLLLYTDIHEIFNDILLNDN